MAKKRTGCEIWQKALPRLRPMADGRWASSRPANYQQAAVRVPKNSSYCRAMECGNCKG